MQLNLYGRVAALALGVLLVTCQAHAATLSGTLTAEEVTEVDLTVEGNLDWAYWDSSDGSDPGTTVKTNQKADGVGIGVLIHQDPTTNSSLLGRNVQHGFTYSDGVSPTSETVAGGEYGIDISGTLAEISDATLTLPITASSTGPQTLSLYGTHRRTGTEITASLVGAGSDDVVSLNPTDTENQGWVYTLNFQADDVGDILTVTIGSSGSSQDASNTNNSIRFAAATLVPEPASIALLLFAGAALVATFLRRRIG